MPNNKEKRIFYEDLIIKQKLLNRDRIVTNEFYYKGCYPIFLSLWKRYHTDCESPFELMNQIYVLMLSPGKRTGKCQLENFRGESTLRSWIKTVALFYCYKAYGDQQITIGFEDGGDRSDRKRVSNSGNGRVIISIGDMVSEEMDVYKEDMKRLIALMPNKRYAKVIRLFKIDGFSNDEVADELGVTLANLYNIHARAEEQFNTICEREERYVK